MKSFRNHIVILRDDTKYDFPENYGNEIFYSKMNQEENDHVEYESNFSIKYIHSGTEKYLVNGKLKTVNGGKMLVVNDRSHVVNMAGVSEAFSIFIRPEIINECLKCLTKNESQLLDQPFDRPHSFPNFYDNVVNHNIESLTVLKNKVLKYPNLVLSTDYYFELAEELLRQQIKISKSIGNIEKLKFQTRKEIFRRIELAKDYLNDNIHSKFDLEDLASASYMSKYQLIRCFKQIYGITPNRYFIIKKLSKARHDVSARSNSTIKEIAYKFGYPNQSAFSKQFKQIYGFSPSTLSRVVY